MLRKGKAGGEGPPSLSPQRGHRMVKKIGRAIMVLLVALCLFVPSGVAGATAIDVGPGATDRATNFSEGNTVFDLANPANDTGVITSLELWFNTSATGVRMGTFYLISGSTFHCRDSVSIGNVTSGSKQTFNGLSVNITSGDYIGFYCATGLIEAAASGGSGVRYYYGANKCTTGTEASYTLSSGQAVSIYGTGGPPVVIATVTTQAVSDIGTDAAVGHGTITDTGGENCSKRGVCWNTTGNPTVSDTKSEETGSFGAGAFSRPIPGLISGTTYYVRAYAYNNAGYGYGGQVVFGTGYKFSQSGDNVSGTMYRFIHSHGGADAQSFSHITKGPDHELDSAVSGKDISLQASYQEDKWGTSEKLLLDFDTSTLDDGIEITGGQIRLYLYWKGNAGGKIWSVSFYRFTGDADGSYTLNDDWNEYNFVDFVQLGEPILYSEITEGWNSFDLTQAGIDYINKTGHTAMWMRFSLEAAGLYPVWVSNCFVQYSFTYSGEIKPILSVDYEGEPSPRIVNEEENEDEGDYVGDNITGISWMTPRLAWNDEKAGFRVEGDIGASCNLTMVSDSGVVLASKADVIRSNGFFYWYPELDGYTGRFRLLEGNQVVWSQWAYSEDYVSAGNNRSWAKWLEVPGDSWRRDIKTYVVESSEMMKFYWLSDLAESELGGVNMAVSQGGARTRTMYTDNMSGLVSGYMGCEDADNYNLVSSRYILASMSGVSDDWDGLILDFSNPLVSMAKGFYFYKMWEPGGEGITPASAYWYCRDPNISVDIGGSFVAGGDTTVKVESASELNLRNALSELSVVLYRGDGGVEDSSDGVWSGSDEASLVVVPSDEGSGKWVLFQMGDDDYTHHSIWDLVIGPGGGGGGGGGGGDEVDVLRDMRSWFNRFLALIGLNSAGGRWLFILLLVLLETVFLYKRTLILTLVLCVTIGLAMSADWISPWIISVLGLILGFVIWTMLRRSRHAEG
jgi:hypothetical protein